MAGWIKVYRDLADHWLADDLEKLGWWTILLLKVNHEDKKVLSGNQLVELKKGQIIASLSYLASLWKTSKRTAERFVELLEGDNMVSRCTSRKVTILTICNYESYQEKKTGKRADECVDDEPISIQQVSETKKEKKIYNLDDNISAHAYTREVEPISAYAERYRQEGIWADVAMPCKVSIAQAQAIFEEFIVEQSHNESSYSDYPEFKRHFLNYLRSRAERLRQSSKQESNGNINRQNQRRGVQVVANKVEDYEGPF